MASKTPYIKNLLVIFILTGFLSIKGRTVNTCMNVDELMLHLFLYLNPNNKILFNLSISTVILQILASIN